MVAILIAGLIFKACAKRNTKSDWTQYYVAGESPQWTEHLNEDCAFVTWDNIPNAEWEWIGPRLQTTLTAMEMMPMLARFFPSIRNSIKSSPRVVQAALCVYYSCLIMGAEMSPKDAVGHACSVYFVSDFRTSPSTYAASVATENMGLFNDPLPVLLAEILSPFRNHFHIAAEPKKALQRPS